MSAAPVFLRQLIFSKRRAFQVIFLASTLTTQVPTADAATIRARYSVSYLGVQLGELIIVNNVGPVNYEADLNARLSGLAAVARSFNISIKSKGALKGGLIRPSSYLLSQTGSETRTIRVALAGGNAKAAEIEPPFEKSGPLVPLVEEHKRNVVDPLSALIMPLAQSGGELGPSVCNRTLRLFTGATRADIEFAYAGYEDLKSKAYTGSVAVCSVSYKPIAGYNPDSTMTKSMMANQDIKVRLAPLSDVPYAMLISATVPLPLGTARLALEEYSIEPAQMVSNRASAR
ncbi:Protein of unknown function [Bradyrhizobium sp. Rc2d]|uniref:DUF3108 domain-containing protein n=1 Tax=Bradyrhizobium sp. Rc2d TaxID=1855321 RepID=UPI0008856356|nr:DUF3108 domain-containing protein [Bradyrhizobium sp. Rc2d]SDI64549.1 Protein of unknown function [Bradyrhizobium sp. Rc2d]